MTVNSMSPYSQRKMVKEKKASVQGNDLISRCVTPLLHTDSLLFLFVWFVGLMKPVTSD